MNARVVLSLLMILQIKLDPPELWNEIYRQHTLSVATYSQEILFILFTHFIYSILPNN